MPEDLVPGDVEQYTKGRLSQTDPETVRALNAALAKVRSFCGWHVSPVRTETIILDRPEYNYPTLILPTLKVVELTSITVDGVAIDLSNVRMSREAPGVLAQKNNQPWGGYRWDNGLGLVHVTLDHGFTAAEAEDFRGEVLRLIDVASLAVGTGADGPLEEKQVDDVTYRWSRVPDRLVDSIARNPMDSSALYGYQLLAL